MKYKNKTIIFWCQQHDSIINLQYGKYGLYYNCSTGKCKNRLCGIEQKYLQDILEYAKDSDMLCKGFRIKKEHLEIEVKEITDDSIYIYINRGPNKRKRDRYGYKN